MLARLRESATKSCPSAEHNELLPVLADDIFEELGYFGALDDGGDEPESDDDYDEFFRRLAGLEAILIPA
jgi:hypothetical protein